MNLQHGLRTPREEVAFTARPKIHSHSQIFKYGRNIFCLPHRPKFHWVFVVCAMYKAFVANQTLFGSSEVEN